MNGAKTRDFSRSENESPLSRDTAEGRAEAKRQAQRRWRKVKHTVHAQRAFVDAGKQRRNRSMPNQTTTKGTLSIPAPKHTPSIPRSRTFPANPSSGPKVNEKNLIETARSRINSVSGPSLPGESRSAGQAVGSFAARMTSEVCKDCNLISNHIVIGGRATAKDLGKLQDLGVTHILNVCQQLPNFHPSKFAYMKIDVLDDPSTQLTDHHQKTSQFIHHVEEMGGRVFVHCIAGCSRSVTIVLMHLIAQHNICLRDGWDHMRYHRPQMCPNEGFKIQLAQVELDKFGASSMVDFNDKAWDFYEWNKVKRTLPKLSRENGRPSISKACVVS